MGRAQGQPAAVTVDPFAVVLGVSRGGGLRAQNPDGTLMTAGQKEELFQAIGPIASARLQHALDQAELLVDACADNNLYAAAFEMDPDRHAAALQQWKPTSVQIKQAESIYELLGEPFSDLPRISIAAQLYARHLVQPENTLLAQGWLNGVRYALATSSRSHTRADEYLRTKFHDVPLAQLAVDLDESEPAVVRRSRTVGVTPALDVYTDDQIIDWLALDHPECPALTNRQSLTDALLESSSLNSRRLLSASDIAEFLKAQPQIHDCVCRHGDPEALRLLQEDQPAAGQSPDPLWTQLLVQHRNGP